MVLDPAFSTGRLSRSGIPSLSPLDVCLSNRIRSEPHQASACLCTHCIICIRGVHNMHFRGIPACIICISRMHNMHQTRAQYAYGAIQTAAPRTARQADPLAFTHGHRKTNSPARGNPEKTGGRLAAAPSHIQSGLAARLPAKSMSGQQRQVHRSVVPWHAPTLETDKKFWNSIRKRIIRLVTAARRPVPPRSHTGCP